MSSASALYSKLPFDPAKDFVPVTMVISTQFVIAGSPKDPATNLTELAKEAKAKPGTLNFGSSGPGSSLHIFAEMFNNLTGIKMVHVPYRGDAPMVTALMSNDIQLAFLPQANGIASAIASRRWIWRVDFARRPALIRMRARRAFAAAWKTRASRALKMVTVMDSLFMLVTCAALDRPVPFAGLVAKFFRRSRCRRC